LQQNKDVDSVPIQTGIKLLAASRDSDAALPNLGKLSSSDETTDSWLFTINFLEINGANSCNGLQIIS
jgi:hypothetical protein